VNRPGQIEPNEFELAILEDASAQVIEQRIGLDDLIVMPNVQNGMGAVLFCRGGQPKCLETYTFADELWDGVFEGFVIQNATGQS